MSFAIYQLIVFMILISFDVGTAIYQRYIEKKETHVSFFVGIISSALILHYIIF
jgi:hypothetical protein